MDALDERYDTSALEAQVSDVEETASETAEVINEGRLSEASLTAAYVTAAAHAEFNIERYGAPKGKMLTDASMAAGSNVLHSASHDFTSADIGKKIGVLGAGPISTDYAVLANDGVLVTTIASVSDGDAVLTDAAVTTGSGMRAFFGFPIDEAFLAASAAATASGGGNVFIPAGLWLASETMNYQATNIMISGAGRAHSIVYYVHTGVANSNSTTPCFRGLGPGILDGGKPGASFKDFTVDGQFFVSTGGWSSEMKLIQLTQTVDAILKDLAILNCPATAIGYDLSSRCTIEGNTILNAGRMAPISAAFSGAAGSGIGIAIEKDSPIASCIIRDNFITGAYGNPVGGGRTGIHLEGVYASTDAPSGSYIVSGNIISGFSIGIRDSGALGTIISDNIIHSCQWGIQLGTKGAATSRLPLDTIVEGNVIRDLVNRFAPSGTSYGILISTQTTTDETAGPEGRFLVQGNSIARVPGHGVYLRGDPYPLNHVRIENNSIRDCDGCGINVENVVNDLAILHNGISGNGRGGGNTTHAIRIGSGVVWTGGRIEGNDFTDLGSPTTQTNSITIVAGAVMTNVRRTGNTDDPATTTVKTNTTTINNNSTLATVGAYSLTLLPNARYQFEALIEYSTDTAAGLKLRWTLPTGASLNWTIDGAGAPDVGVLVATSQVTVEGTGVGVLRVARVSGLLTTAATGGTVTLTAAQLTPTALDTVITPRSVMSVARA